MQKIRLGKKDYNWHKYLDDVVNDYNNTEHRTIHAKPLDVLMVHADYCKT